MFKSKLQRQKFMCHLGIQYASMGGQFGAYRLAEDAFEVAKASHLYSRAGIGKADFKAFSLGFKKFQRYRIAMQKFKADSQAKMQGILNEVDLLGQGDKLKDYKDVAEMIAAQDAVA